MRFLKLAWLYINYQLGIVHSCGSKYEYYGWYDEKSFCPTCEPYRGGP